MGALNSTKKTSKIYDIKKFTEQMQKAILKNFYLFKKNKADFIFPVPLKRVHWKSSIQRFSVGIKNYNKRSKKIADLLLYWRSAFNSYVSKDISFATHLPFLKMFPLAAISAYVWTNKLSTTQRYT